MAATCEPNLVIIGAQKSGTTSIYHYLNAHPEIFMSSPIKEPGYFMKTEFILSLFRRINHPVASREEMLERFMLRGYRPARYFGEASTYYTLADYSRKHRIPARMKEADPNMRLIYILRNPYARIVSGYLHALRAGYAQGDLAQFLATDLGRHAVLTSRYWHQLQPYLEYFPQDQIKIVLFETLVDDGQRMVDDIFRFLDIEPAGKTRLDTHNRSVNRNAFKDEDLLFPSVVFQTAKRVIEPEVRQLEEFMQRSLEVWNLSMERWCGPSREP
jgi:hypothetical protein